MAKFKISNYSGVFSRNNLTQTMRNKYSSIDLRSIGCRFKSYSGQCCITTLGKVFTPCASVTKQYKLVPAKGWCCCVARKVTAGLAESNGSLLPDG